MFNPHRQGRAGLSGAAECLPSKARLISSNAMSLQGYRNGPATQGSALFGASQLGASQDAYGFTQDLNFTQDGTASFSDYPQFTGLSQVRAAFCSLFCCRYACYVVLSPPPAGHRKHLE